MTNDLNQVLISGADYLAARPDFKFVGRTKERRDLQEILMQRNSNCIVLTGASGVGMTGLVMGLQAAKAEPAIPPKLLNMPLYFLDADKLFESGDSSEINKTFREVRTKLAAVPGTVLYIENMGNFIDGCTKNGCSNLMNGLLGDIKKGKYQTVLETPYEDLGKVIKYNSEMKAAYTLRDLQEPKGDDLKAIIAAAVPGLEKHHGIRISPEAVALAITLATKHRTATLQAMPAGVIVLLDRALSSYALKAHSEPFQLLVLEGRLLEVTDALAGSPPEHLKEHSKEVLETKGEVLREEIKAFKAAWNQRQTELRTAYTRQQSAQQRITKLETKLADLLSKEDKDNKDVGESADIVKVREDIAAAQLAVQVGTKKYDEITALVNKELMMGEMHVLDTFSDITNIPVKKLTQSDRDRILGIEEKLNDRVFDQGHAVKKVCNAIRNSSAGLGEEGKPKGNFLFLGPSGVGKTELVKALRDLLFDDPNALFRIDMSEYMEKNAANKLIGPPPGFVGFEEGGVLTEAMQKKPVRIVLVDEIEKAHPDVLNLFLQALDDGRLTDGKGVTVTFEDVLFIFTSNVGQGNFPDRNVDYDAAVAESIKELKQAGIRNELLNRFGGKRNVIGFYPLEAHTMERIVRRELNTLNARLQKSGLAIRISDADIKKLGHALYNPDNGARAVPGYFADEIKTKASAIILESPNSTGVFEMKYNEKTRAMDLLTFNGQSSAPVPDGKDLQSQMRRAAQPQPANG